MNQKLFLVLFSLAFSFFSCQPNEPDNPIIGMWEWSSGSRVLLPSGFERFHRDRSPTYLVGDAEFNYVFDKDGAFESSYTPPGMTSNVIAGFWSMENDSLFLDVTEPQGYGGLTQYKVPFSDESNLDLQWSVQYLEFSDVQIEELKNDGIVGPDGWTMDKDSLLNETGILITSVITLHFEKI